MNTPVSIGPGYIIGPGDSEILGPTDNEEQRRRNAQGIAELMRGGGSASVEGPDGQMRPIFGGSFGPTNRSGLSNSLTKILESADAIATSGPQNVEFQAAQQSRRDELDRSRALQEKAAQAKELFESMFGPAVDPTAMLAKLQQEQAGITNPRFQPIDVNKVGPQLVQQAVLQRNNQVASSKDAVKDILAQLGIGESESASKVAVEKAKLGGASGDLETTAKKLSNYEVPFTVLSRLAGPQRLAILNRAEELNPNFDITKYDARQAIRKDFASGKAATNIRSINTAVDHLEKLSDAAEALENSDLTLWNTIKNKGLETTGDPRVTRFKNAATAVESELASVFKGTGATDQEIKQWRQNLSSAQSPAQLKAAVKEAVGLMGGRMGAIEDQWLQTMGTKRDVPLLSERSRKILEKRGLLADATGEASPQEASSTGIPQAGFVSRGYRFKGGDPSKKENWEKK